MIYYDSHKWRTLAKIQGSVIPKAVLWSLPSAMLALCLKWQEAEGNIDLELLKVLTQGDIYSGFTFVLGFSLVFRTSQSYLRYWTAATSVFEMGSQWSDSCASLIAFSTISKFPHRDILRFRHTVVRLFSILHAMALEEIASIDAEFPLLDVEGFSKDKLLVLTSGLAQGKKVQVVLSWIKAYISQMSDCGLLDVPPPLLTRVFQELAAGLVSFHQAQAIVIWPFPFPYTQLNLILIQVYTIITPLVISTWATWAWMCCLFTFISVTCMMGLDLIASELENPFGDDPNDLPVLEMQNNMNKVLTMQLNPVLHAPPELLPSAVMDYRELAVQSASSMKRTSLRERIDLSQAVGTIKSTLSSGSRADGMKARLRWSGKASAETEVTRLQRWLKCLPSQTQDVLQEAVQRERLAETMHRDLFAGCPGLDVKDDVEAATSPASASNSASASAPPAPFHRLLASGLDVKDDVWTHERTAGSSNSSLPSLPIQRKAQDAHPRKSQSGHAASGALGGDAPCGLRKATLESCAVEPVLDRRSTCGSLAHSCPPIEESPWGDFLSSLHEVLTGHLENQLEMQRKELQELQGVLLRVVRAPSSGRLPCSASPRSCSSGEDCAGSCRWSGEADDGLPDYKRAGEPVRAVPSTPRPAQMLLGRRQSTVEEHGRPRMPFSKCHSIEEEESPQL